MFSLHHDSTYFSAINYAMLPIKMYNYIQIKNEKGMYFNYVLTELKVKLI